MADPRARETLRPELLRQEMRRILAEVVRDTDEVIAHHLPTPASLHRLHRDLRRLRTALSVWEELLGSAGRAQLRPLSVRIRRLTRLVGQVRDRDVAVSLLDSVADQAGSEEEEGQLHLYRTRLEEDARTGRELLRAFLRSERQAQLFDLLSDVFDLRTRSLGPATLQRVLTDHQHRGRAKVVEAHRRARRRPSMDRLHRLRIRVRRLRQMSDLASAVDPAHDPALARSLRRLQQNLGRLHDLDVLVHDLDPLLQKTGWGRGLRKERRRQRKAIAKFLDKRKPGRLREVGTVSPPATPAARTTST